MKLAKVLYKKTGGGAALYSAPYKSLSDHQLLLLAKHESSLGVSFLKEEALFLGTTALCLPMALYLPAVSGLLALMAAAYALYVEPAVKEQRRELLAAGIKKEAARRGLDLDQAVKNMPAGIPDFNIVSLPPAPKPQPVAQQTQALPSHPLMKKR